MGSDAYHVWQQGKKMIGPFNITIIIYFWSINPYQKIDEAQQMFSEDIVLYICKAYWLISIVENILLRRLVLHQCPQVSFFSQIIFVDEMFPRMVQKTLDLHVFPNIVFITIVSCSFDLWMSNGNHCYKKMWLFRRSNLIEMFVLTKGDGCFD